MVRYKQLTSVAFVSALAVLLLNDFYLKSTFSNWFTGKLSDFAGLFIFPLFWSVLFPKQAKAIFISTALAFVYWKSAYSQEFIDAFNSIMPFAIERTVDMGDCIALLILPLSWIYFHKKETYLLRIKPAYIIPIVAFAFIATSKARGFVVDNTYRFDYSVEDLRTGICKEFKTDTNTVKLSPTTFYLHVSEFKSCTEGYGVWCMIYGTGNKSYLNVNSYRYTCEPNKKDYSDKEINADFARILSTKLGGERIN